MPVRKALVPVDGSEVSIKAARVAAEFAAKHGWEIVLLHVLEPPPMPGFAFPDDVKRKALLDIEEEGRRILEQADEVFKPAGVNVDGKLVEGPVAETIAAEIEAAGCGIVVLGSTGMGRGKLGSILLGSVAEQVIRKVKVPVLLVKADTDLGRLGVS